MHNHASAFLPPTHPLPRRSAVFLTAGNHVDHEINILTVHRIDQPLIHS